MIAVLPALAPLPEVVVRILLPRKAGFEYESDEEDDPEAGAAKSVASGIVMVRMTRSHT